MAQAKAIAAAALPGVGLGYHGKMLVNAFCVLVWCLFAAWAIQIGRRKNRLFAGIVLGISLAWAGTIVMALLPPARDSRDSPG